MFRAWLTLPAQSPFPVPVGMEPPPQGYKECQAALKQYLKPTEPWQGLKLGDGEMSERGGGKRRREVLPVSSRGQEPIHRVFSLLGS